MHGVDPEFLIVPSPGLATSGELIMAPSPPHSAPIKREYPATSAVRIAFQAELRRDPGLHNLLANAAVWLHDQAARNGRTCITIALRLGPFAGVPVVLTIRRLPQCWPSNA